MSIAQRKVSARLATVSGRIDNKVEQMNQLEQQVAELYEDVKAEYCLYRSSNDLDEQEHSYRNHVAFEKEMYQLNNEKAITLIQTNVLIEEQDFLKGLLETFELEIGVL